MATAIDKTVEQGRQMRSIEMVIALKNQKIKIKAPISKPK